ncbi:beta-galactosidase [Parabacteroides merdae]|jgi:beta-galactosidase|uniref:glycoside hydrolase family 2 protein n=1 Tax=Parabacteroides merdae TaxID=46503 RepID=UPI000EFAD7DE|nr:glycoside hydrolase family 2 TIM barrel-domain containing protein [Parabacteroides merdae]RGT04754.1 beta-galactosidase [Parabacteroides merdae]
MKQIKTILFAFGCSLLLSGTKAFAQVERLPDEASYPVLQELAGVETPAVLLSGTWQFRYSPDSKWDKIQVPGEPAMQGYAIEHDKPFTYRKSFTVPADYAGKHTILRFDGVYSYARLFVNDTFVREHHGGFTRWETDVTPFVRPGKKNEIRLEVTDRLDDISYASGYAHHPIGGILRDVTLFTLPETCLYDFYAETHLDAAYEDAVLKIGYSSPVAGGAEVAYTLTDPSGRRYPLAQSRFPLEEGGNMNELPVKNPLKWDAEHPNLYTLTITLSKDGKEIGRFDRRIGFRDVKIEKDRMLVNGMPVKLRGACRHDIHPTLGRTTTAELDSLDVILFKRSNMNFVRTSHYPPTERFLEYCDRYGIYVESETAVCFVDTYRQKNYAPGKTQDSAEFTPRYLSQCREMVKSFRSHPSILFWSIGNESVYGTNFQQCWDWVKATDKTRPVIFSYPGSVGEKKPVYDILSMHYQDVNGNLNQWNRSTHGFQGEGIPALFDEWAHPACYTYATLQEDPNIREFWGHSIERMWSGLFDAPGGLGGAIWGYVDETFMLPEPKVGTAFWKEFARTAKPEDYQGKCVGYGEWGIVDVWRREKPEFWATKKAYSPVRLMTTEVASFLSGQRLLLPLYNRFDHTDLDEIKIRYTYKGVEKELPAPSIAPHQKGLLVIPAEAWEEGELLSICFYTATGELLDAEQVSLGSDYHVRLADSEASPVNGVLQVEETAGMMTIKGDGFEIPFSKETGLISNATSKGQVIIEKGPFLHLDINLNHLTGAEVRKSARKFLTSDSDWKKQSLTYTRKEGAVEVALSGFYQDVQTDILIRISPAGEMNVSYVVAGQPNGYLRETGLSFYLPERLDYLQWERKGMWSCYPEGAFAGNTGETSLYNPKQVRYGENPAQPWSADTHNYYYWADAGANCDRPLTQMAKGMKENIYRYTLSATGVKAGLTVCSPDASLACRTSKRGDGQLMLYINNRWDYPEIAWGNYCKTLEAVPCYGEMKIRF